jgi:hypothetical protein
MQVGDAIGVDSVGELVGALQRPALAPEATNTVKMQAMSLMEGIVGIGFWLVLRTRGKARAAKGYKLDNSNEVWVLSRHTLLFRRSNGGNSLILSMA